jgi:hypothetical protein
MNLFWDGEYGIWTLIRTKWFSIHGTTPRNADVWSLDIDLGKYSLCFSTGVHASVEFWSGDTLHQFQRNKPDCRCFTCRVYQPLPPEVKAKLVDILKDMRHVHVYQEDFKGCDDPELCDGLLPPRTPRHDPDHVCETSRCWSECHPPGCHPADCCGDPEAHRER